jgi:glycosyltransferase involved in cell wall biosynthesis
MKKICIIGQFPPPMHGLSKALDTLYRGLNETFDFEKIDITNNKKIFSNLLKILRSKADVFYFTISQTVGGNKRDLWILKLIAAKEKKCVIHLHGGYYRTMVENELSPRQKKANLRAMQKVDCAIVLSPALKDIFSGMVPSDRIAVVENGVDDEFVPSEQAIEEKVSLLPRKEILQVLYLSNFNREKGYREVLALAACEKTHAESTGRQTFRFDFAGEFFDQEEREYFFEFIQKNDLEGYVTYHGTVGGEEKKKLLYESDIFALLTRYPKEGQPISILESMANGLAVVTCDHAAIPDMVQDGTNGIVCGAGEEKRSLALYTKMLEMRSRLPQIARENYKKVKANYTQEKYLGKLKKILDEIDSEGR